MIHFVYWSDPRPCKVTFSIFLKGVPPSPTWKEYCQQSEGCECFNISDSLRLYPPDSQRNWGSLLCPTLFKTCICLVTVFIFMRCVFGLFTGFPSSYGCCSASKSDVKSPLYWLIHFSPGCLYVLSLSLGWQMLSSTSWILQVMHGQRKGDQSKLLLRPTVVHECCLPPTYLRALQQSCCSIQ